MCDLQIMYLTAISKVQIVLLGLYEILYLGPQQHQLH